MDESGGIGPHPGLKRLLDYRAGTLPAAEREGVQEHLSLCPRCTGLLREARDFEEAAARGEAGPEPLRREAWDSLSRRLAAEAPVRPAAEAEAARREPPRRLFSRAGAAAALLLAALGLALWATFAVLPDREGRIERAAGPVALSVAPRFVIRGQENPGGAWLKEGEVNPVRKPPREDRLTVALSLESHPDYPEYRLTLTDWQGRVLGAVRKPAGAVLGDATAVSIAGLGPGRYRLRVEGLPPAGGRLLAEYLLEVEP